LDDTQADSHGESLEILQQMICDALSRWWWRAPAALETNSRARDLQELLAKLLDSLCLPGHEVTEKDWRQACLLAGRYCEPFLSKSFATPPAPEPGEGGELVEMLTQEAAILEAYCNKIANGECSTLACLQRGGYIRGTESPDSSVATCPELEKAVAKRRAATLLQQQEAELAALVQQLAEPAKALVVPVNEQPWNRPGWCDAEGRCWFCNSYSMGSWNYDTPPDPAQDWGRLGTVTHSAPHWAIPRPGRMPELPNLSVYSYDAGESVRISRMGESNCWCIIASGLIPDWWFNLEMHYDFASAGAALAAIRLAQQTAKKSEET
jgi:hypothetical protein